MVELWVLVHAARWRDPREDFAVVRWYLHGQEAAFAAAYHIKGYTHALREQVGVMAGFLLGHNASLSVMIAVAVMQCLRPGLQKVLI